VFRNNSKTNAKDLKKRESYVNFPHFISCDNMELSLTCLSLEPDGCKHTTHSTEAGGNFPRSEVASPLGQFGHQDSEILVLEVALLLTQLLNQPIYSFILRRRSI
jgi:hypothetical protein